jgi:hypothetical protein
MNRDASRHAGLMIAALVLVGQLAQAVPSPRATR